LIPEESSPNDLVTKTSLITSLIFPKTIEAMAVGGRHLWLANFAGNSLTELDSADGALIRVISTSVGHFNGPGGIAISGSNVRITNLL
jgi:hypothetical protein